MNGWMDAVSRKSNPIMIIFIKKNSSKRNDQRERERGRDRREVVGINRIYYSLLVILRKWFVSA